MSRQGWRLVVALVVIAGSIPTVSDLAFAALQSTTSNSTAQSFVSAKWAVGAVDTVTVNPSSSNYTITVARSTSGATGSYFSLKNVGTVTTASLTMFETITGSSASTTVNIDACSTTWNEATGACTGGTITNISARVNNVAALSIPYFVVIPAGGSKRLRIQYVKTGGASTVTAVFAIAISKTQIRTAVSTNG